MCWIFMVQKSNAHPKGTAEVAEGCHPFDAGMLLIAWYCIDDDHASVAAADIGFVTKLQTSCVQVTKPTSLDFLAASMILSLARR